MQSFVDAFMRAQSVTRQQYHLTLGQLIDMLRDQNPDLPVVFDTGGSPIDPHSYRGYYDDLAFETTSETRTVAEVLKEAEECLGACFEGYKGGEFRMGEDTPLWNAYYGDTGRAIILALPISEGVQLLTKGPYDYA